MLKCIEDLQGPWPRFPTKLAPEILLPWTCHACVSHFQCLNLPGAGSYPVEGGKSNPHSKDFPHRGHKLRLLPNFTHCLSIEDPGVLRCHVDYENHSPWTGPKTIWVTKGYSSANALIDMLHTWHSNIDGNGKTLHIFLLDFSKAFDRINHKVLVTKMHQRGINKSIVNWVIDFLNGRIQRVCGEAFDWSAVNGGVPQGTVYYRMNVLVETKFGNLHSTNRICFGLVGCQVAP